MWSVPAVLSVSELSVPLRMGAAYLETVKKLVFAWPLLWAEYGACTSAKCR